jgi:hypothetical protein
VLHSGPLRAHPDRRRILEKIRRIAHRREIRNGSGFDRRTPAERARSPVRGRQDGRIRRAAMGI